MPTFTEKKIDRAYESFMKQVPGFRRDSPEGKEIQQDLERKQRKKGERNDNKSR